MTTETKTYLSLKLASARKTSIRATGDITYRILCDENREAIFLTIVGNDGGGYWSREILPLERIENCLANFTDGKPFRAKNLCNAFIGKSVNTWGFLLAALRAECLVAPVADASHQYQKAGDWADWKETMLCADGLVYVPPTKPDTNSAAKTQESTEHEATESTSAEQSADDSAHGSPDDAETPRRKGRGSKARAVGVSRDQESDDARST